MSSSTSSPAAMIRRTCAPSLVCCCTCQRKMSPTLMCTRSRSALRMAACVPLPLPWTPMMTYLRIPPPFHTEGRPSAGKGSSGWLAPVLDLPGVVERVPGAAPGGETDRPAARHRRCPVAGPGEHRADIRPQRGDRGGVAGGGLAVPDAQLAGERRVRAEHVIDDLAEVPAASARALPQPRGRRVRDLVEHLPRRHGQGGHPRGGVG